MSTQTSSADVLILGAGPAGLSCAAGLSRLLHTTLIFSSPTTIFRNAKAGHMHNILTWDHKDPALFRAAARKELSENYATNRFVDIGISRVERMASGGFKAVDDNGKEWFGKKLVLGTGVTDIMPDIEGYEECWVSGIFHCLFCHGYEERGSQSAGVLAIDDCANAKFAINMARFTSRLAEKVVIYTNGNESVTKEIENALLACNQESKTRRVVSVDSRKIVKLVKGATRADVDVVLEGGEVRTEGFIAHKPKDRLNGPWVEQLGLETTDTGDIKVNFPFNETSVSGVFAVGDCGTMMKAAPVAVSMGGLAAAGIASALGAED